MITFSGTRIEPSTKFDGAYLGTPTLTDIALGLSRMPRFGGQTRRWWSVLLHSLVCYELAGDSMGTEKQLLLCLLHDGHEAITADVPAFFKSPHLKEWQNEIDERFFYSLGLLPVSKEDTEFVKMIDTLALRAEAELLGPPTIMQHIAIGPTVCLNVVRNIMQEYPDAKSSEGLESPAVKRFFDCFSEVFREATGSVSDDTPNNQPTLVEK